MLWTLLAAAVVAAPVPMTFDEALSATESLPEVLAARRAADALANASRDLPSVLSQPHVGLQPGYRVYERDQRGVEAQLSVSQTIPLFDARGAQGQVLDAEHRVRLAQAARVLLDARLAAAAAWLGAWDAREEMRAALAERDAARESLARVRKGAEGGAFTAADVADEESYVAERELAMLGAEGLLFDRTTELAAATARPALAVIDTTGALPAPAVPDDAAFDGLLARAGALPLPLAESLTAAAARARAAEATRLQGPQLAVGGTIQREAPSNLIVFGTLGLTLPAFDLGLRERAPAESVAEEMDSRAALATRAAAAELVRARHEVEHTAEVLGTVRDRLLPALEASARLNGVLAEQAEVTVLELLHVRRRLAAARTQLSRATAAHALARVRLALLSSSIPGGAP